MFSTADIAAAGRTTLRGARLWEKTGLFGPVARNERGDRTFTEDHIDRAKVIGAAQMCGMSIAEIRAMFSAQFPGNVILEKIFAAREFLDEVEAVVMRDRREVFDL